MSFSTFARLTAGFTVAILLYVYTPILDFLSLALFCALGVFWAAVVVDVVLTSTGVIIDMGHGVSQWGTSKVTNAQDWLSKAKQDVRDRVEEIQHQQAAQA